MAKKSKVVSDCCAPTACEYKPRLYLRLDGQDVAQVKGLSVGEEVEILVTGKVVGLQQEERSNHEEKQVKSGSIDLEGYRVRVMGEDDNEFGEDED